MQFSFRAIGFVHTQTANEDIPRHWSVSNVRGFIEIDPHFAEGLTEIIAGEQIVILFAFHQSQKYTAAMLKQTSPRQSRAKGVFSTCSPVRPNPIGISIVKVLSISGCTIAVEGLDMFDGTPVLDIKPHILRENHCAQNAHP